MKKYKDITKEDIEKVLEEIYGEDAGNITYEELRARVAPGYWYSVVSPSDGENTRSVNLKTGSGGILLLIDEFEKTGMPAFIIARDIMCYIDGKNYPLSDIKIKKVE